MFNGVSSSHLNQKSIFRPLLFFSQGKLPDRRSPNLEMVFFRRRNQGLEIFKRGPSGDRQIRMDLTALKSLETVKGIRDRLGILDRAVDINRPVGAVI